MLRFILVRLGCAATYGGTPVVVVDGEKAVGAVGEDLRRKEEGESRDTTLAHFISGCGGS